MQQVRTSVKVDLTAIRSNLRVLSDKQPSKRLIAVVKADAYGHGAVKIADAVKDLVWGFGVATEEEAVELRESGVEQSILILGYTEPDSYMRLLSHGITFTIFRESDAVRLSKAANQLHVKAKIHIALDTGMSRIGFRPERESAAAIARIANLSGICMEGIFSHYACADMIDQTFTKEQLRCFQEFCRLLKEEYAVQIPLRHIGNSAAILTQDSCTCELIRAGIAMYGLCPSEDMIPFGTHLIPALSWETEISHLHTVPAGTTVSYGATVRVERETRIATLPVGYADGYPRMLSGKGFVLIHGNRAQILGRICMDQMMVDVTEIPNVEIGERVVLIGKDGADQITMEDLERLSQRFRYEIPCLISKRVPRLYEESDCLET